MNKLKKQNLLPGDILRWCFSTLGCPDLTLAETVALANRFGLDAIEIRALSGSVDIVERLRCFQQQHSSDFFRLKATGTITMLDTSFSLLTATAADEQQLFSSAMLADVWGIPTCRIFGGFKYSENPSPILIRRAAASWKVLTRTMTDNGIACSLVLETHDGFSSAVNCQMLFDALGYAMPILWDVHHTWRYGREELAATYRLLADKIVHIHVKDSIITQKGQIASVLPGLGDVPIVPLLDILRSERFSHPVSLEWERLWEPELPPLEDALFALKSRWYKNQPI